MISHGVDPGRTQPCCPDDHGGSHYHCGRCGQGGTSMMGHFTRLCRVARTIREHHFCCPNDCTLEAADG